MRSLVNCSCRVALTEIRSHVSMNPREFSNRLKLHVINSRYEGGSHGFIASAFYETGRHRACHCSLGRTCRLWWPSEVGAKGSGAFNEKDSKAFYGVGAVVGVRNEPLAWDTAENRARAEIAKTFETYTGYLMRDYAASTTAGDFTRNTEEQNVERAIKTVTTATLSGVRPIDRYKDEKTNTFTSLPS